MADSRESFSSSEDGDPGSPVSERSSAETLPVTCSHCSGVGTDTTNPFEVDPVDLTQTCSSPSMFLSGNPGTPESDRSFRWSIEQMSALWPADIDEHELSRQQATRSDTSFEQQWQEAADLFFSQNKVVPSPLGSIEEQTLWPAGVSDGGPRQTTTVSVSTQTALSVPPVADLVQAVLKFCASLIARNKRATSDPPSTSRDSTGGQLVCSVAAERAQTPERSNSGLRLCTDSAMERPPARDRAGHSKPIGSAFWSRPANTERAGAQRSAARRPATTPLESPRKHSRKQLDSTDGERTYHESASGISDLSILMAPEDSDDMLFAPSASDSPR